MKEITFSESQPFKNRDLMEIPVINGPGMVLKSELGTTAPSEADQKITKKLVDTSALLEITVLDHIILANDQFYSFADEGSL